MQNFQILDWQKMVQPVIRAMSLRGSWGHMDMLPLSILQQVGKFYMVFLQPHVMHACSFGLLTYLQFAECSLRYLVGMISKLLKLLHPWYNFCIFFFTFHLNMDLCASHPFRLKRFMLLVPHFLSL